MSLTTKQDRAILWAKNMQTLALTILNLQAAIDDAVAENTDEDWMTFFNGCSTAPWLTNGTQGATDATPNNAHAIVDPAIGNSWTGLNGMLLAIQNLQSAMTGQSIAVNRDVHKACKDILSGV